LFIPSEFANEVFDSAFLKSNAPEAVEGSQLRGEIDHGSAPKKPPIQHKSQNDQTSGGVHLHVRHLHLVVILS
jgi:hypothetical protein